MGRCVLKTLGKLSTPVELPMRIKEVQDSFSYKIILWCSVVLRLFITIKL